MCKLYIINPKMFYICNICKIVKPSFFFIHTNILIKDVHDVTPCATHHYEKLCLQQLDYPITKAPKQLIYNCIATDPWQYDKLINKMSH
jgi:hypothetical protein